MAVKPGVPPASYNDTPTKRTLDLLAKRNYKTLRALFRGIEAKVRTGLDKLEPIQMRSLLLALKEARSTLKEFYSDLASSQCPRCSGSLGKPASPLSLAFPDLAQLLIKIDRERSGIASRVLSDPRALPSEQQDGALDLAVANRTVSDPRELL